MKGATDCLALGESREGPATEQRAQRGLDPAAPGPLSTIPEGLWM